MPVKKYKNIISRIICFAIGFIVTFRLCPAKTDIPAYTEYPPYKGEISPQEQEGRHKISPVLRIGQGGSYTVKADYTADYPVEISLGLISEYDPETGIYPLIPLGTLSPGQNTAYFSFEMENDARQAVIMADHTAGGRVQFDDVDIYADSRIYNNRLITSVTVAVFRSVTGYYICKILTAATDKKQKSGQIFVLTGLVLIILVSSAGFTFFEVIEGDDYIFHFNRVLGIAENIRNGVPFLKINYAFDGGYGYLNPVFYPELFLYIPAVMVVMGCSVATAVNLFGFIINGVTAFICYRCFTAISSNRFAGLLCTAVYCLNYYRLRNIYVRSALGEVLFMAFLPVVIYGIYLIFHNMEDKWHVLAIGCCAVFQSHILGTVLTTIAGGLVIVLYSAAMLIKKQNIAKQFAALVKAGVATLLLNLWFLVPMLYYLRHDFNMFVVDDYFRLFTHPVHTDSILNILFRYSGYSYPHVGFLTGVIFALLSVALICDAIKKRIDKDRIIWLGASALFLFARSNIMPWHIVNNNPAGEFLIRNIQFSFRFASLFCACFVTALACYFCGKKKNNAFAVAGTVAMIAFSMLFYTADGCEFTGFDYDFDRFVQAAPEYRMKGSFYDYEYDRKSRFSTSSDAVEIKGYKRSPEGMEVKVINNSSENRYFELPLFYYVGYKAYDENNDFIIAFGANGVIAVELPAGYGGTVEIQYKNHPLFYVARAVSLLGAAGVLVYINNTNKQKKIH